MREGEPAVLKPKAGNGFFSAIESIKGILINGKGKIEVRPRLSFEGLDYLGDGGFRFVALTPFGIHEIALATDALPIEGAGVLEFRIKITIRIRIKKEQGVEPSVADDDWPRFFGGLGGVGQAHVVGLEFLARFLKALEDRFKFDLERRVGGGNGGQFVGQVGGLYR